MPPARSRVDALATSLQHVAPRKKLGRETSCGAGVGAQHALHSSSAPNAFALPIRALRFAAIDTTRLAS
jgi:hypothetical protein